MLIEQTFGFTWLLLASKIQKISCEWIKHSNNCLKHETNMSVLQLLLSHLFRFFQHFLLQPEIFLENVMLAGEWTFEQLSSMRKESLAEKHWNDLKIYFRSSLVDGKLVPQLMPFSACRQWADWAFPFTIWLAFLWPWSACLCGLWFLLRGDKITSAFAKKSSLKLNMEMFLGNRVVQTTTNYNE